MSKNQKKKSSSVNKSAEKVARKFALLFECCDETYATMYQNVFEFNPEKSEEENIKDFRVEYEDKGGDWDNTNMEIMGEEELRILASRPGSDINLVGFELFKDPIYNKPKELDVIHHASSLTMKALPDNSVHLVVTSPPYNVGKEYEEPMMDSSHISHMKSIFREVYRVLVPGGRCCINIANTGRKPYNPAHKDYMVFMEDLGYLMRGEVIWNKGASAGASCAWGSWLSASDPSLRDTHEYILIYSKEVFGRLEKGHSSIPQEEFLDNTRSVWEFSTENAAKNPHPAPFPVELPKRLIQLYSFIGDTVLDPFCGSGTTCVAAKRLRRQYVGYEGYDKYVDMARARVANTLPIE